MKFLFNFFVMTIKSYTLLSWKCSICHLLFKDTSCHMTLHETIFSAFDLDVKGQLSHLRCAMLFEPQVERGGLGGKHHDSN